VLNLTIRLAVLVGDEAQVGDVAVDVKPPESVVAVSAVPVD
jgi:hypothetical protein